MVFSSKFPLNQTLKPFSSFPKTLFNCSLKHQKIPYSSTVADWIWGTRPENENKTVLRLLTQPAGPAAERWPGLAWRHSHAEARGQGTGMVLPSHCAAQ